MAKKKRSESSADEGRQSRKEVLRARKEERENRQVRMAVLAIVAVIAVILVAAIVVEFVVRPSQAVATVNGETISLGEWQARVRYQRAQLIISLEDFTETFDGDIGIVQQFAGQQIGILQNSPAANQALGQQVLDQMIDEALIRQEAERRGITVTEAEIDEALAEAFRYFDGDSPTPLPTATETLVPTPSLTPLPTPVITDVVTIEPVDTPTPGPTNTPRPTATPVTFESYQESLNEELDRLQALGVDESIYRQALAASLYEERLREALVAEAELATDAEHASFYILSFVDEAAANDAVADIAAGDYISVWNEIRSQSLDPEATPLGSATEILWQTRDQLDGNINADVLAEVFSLPVGTASDIIAEEGNEETGEPTAYVIIQVSGREDRPLTESAVATAENEVFNEWLTEARLQVETTELWRTRVPQQPSLAAEYFIAQPTFTPAPVVPVDE